jgi:hypothetical protein
MDDPAADLVADYEIKLKLSEIIGKISLQA